MSSTPVLSSASARTVALDTIANLPNFVQPGDHIFLDIDETLVSPEGDASEPWAVGFKEALESHGISRATAWGVAVELWQALQGSCKVAAPEGELTVSVLFALKRAGHPLVGLTARGPEVAEETLQQLARCGLGGLFGDTSIGELQAPSARDASPAVMPLFHANGIIFCSGSRKPAGLLAFEAATGAASAGKRVILVDDRKMHCDAVGNALAARGREYLGLHYTHLAPHRAGPPGTSAAESSGLARGWVLLASALADRQRARSRVQCALRRLAADASNVEADQAWLGAVAAGAAVGIAVGFAMGIVVMARPRTTLIAM